MSYIDSETGEILQHRPYHQNKESTLLPARDDLDGFLNDGTIVRAMRNPKRRRRALLNSYSPLIGVVWNFALIGLAIGCVVRLWNMNFDFSDFMTGLMQVDFGSFDFAGLTQNVNSWVEDLPSWLDWAGTGIRALAYGALSIGYVVGFVMKVIGYVFAA